MAVVATQRLHGPRDIEAALLGLVARNMLRMRADPDAYPPLSDEPVRYRREPRGVEHWRSADELLRRGYGDCEDLSAYLVAWLRVSGTDPRARVVVKRIRPGLLHVVVQRGDGRMVDPSKALGMKGAA